MTSALADEIGRGPLFVAVARLGPAHALADATDPSAFASMLRTFYVRVHDIARAEGGSIVRIDDASVLCAWKTREDGAPPVDVAATLDALLGSLRAVDDGAPERAGVAFERRVGAALGSCLFDIADGAFVSALGDPVRRAYRLVDEPRGPGESVLLDASLRASVDPARLRDLGDGTLAYS